MIIVVSLKTSLYFRIMVAPIQIYSLFHNINQIDKGKELDIDKSVYFLQFDRTKDIVKEKYKKLWNDLENGVFTYNDLKFYLLYQLLLKKKTSIMNITKAEKFKIKEVAKKFCDEQWERDKEIIVQVCKKINKNSIKEFLDIKKEEDKYVAQDLIEKEMISPMVYIKYYDKITLIDNKFKKIVKIIKEELIKEKEKCKH